MGTLLLALDADQTARLLVADATVVARATQEAHELQGWAALLAAEVVVATALLSSQVKGEEWLTVRVQGSEPRVAVVAEVDATGGLRARLVPSDVEGSDLHLNGVFQVVKSVGTKELYRGASMIDGTVQEALAEHLSASSQVGAVLRLGAVLDEDGKVAFAGGVLLERLPEDRKRSGLSNEAFLDRFGAVSDGDLTTLLPELLGGSLGGRPLQVLEHGGLRWQCRCSQDRIEVALVTLGAASLRELAAEEGQAEVACHFCNQVYAIPGARLVELADALDAPG